MLFRSQHIRRLWYPAPGTDAAIPSRSACALSDDEFAKSLPREFWREVVERVERESPETMLLAEAFWLLEGYFVRGLGLHRVYNSAFMTMLRDFKNAEYRRILRETTAYDPELLRRYVNFLTTPDEEPAAVGFGVDDRALLTATLAATLPGVLMLGHGQWEGQRERYGMEYRVPRTVDPIQVEHVERYDREIAPLLRARHLFAGVVDFRWFDATAANEAVRESTYAFSNAAGSARSLVIAVNSDTGGEIAIHRAAPAAVPFGSLGGGTPTPLPASTIADRLGIAAEEGDVVELRDAITSQSLLVRTEVLIRSGIALRLPAFGRVVFWGIAQHRSTPSEPWGELADAAGGALIDDLRGRLVALAAGDGPNGENSARMSATAGSTPAARRRVTERRSTSETPAADPRLLVTETPAPPEAVRAIAALLGRAAAPLSPAPRRRPPTPQSDDISATSTDSTRGDETVSIEHVHDHEVLVEGEHSELLRLAEDEIERAARRARRAKRAVREALDRISAPAGGDLGG